jgi:hypothetical protein
MKRDASIVQRISQPVENSLSGIALDSILEITSRQITKKSKMDEESATLVAGGSGLRL